MLDGETAVIGRVFDNRYEVIRKVGSGGMADVYLAKDRVLGRQVALKVLSARYSSDKEFVERFRREASAAASLNHPNIAQVYDKGQAEGTYYIAMEFLEGRSLKDVIVKYAPLAPDLIVSVARQIVEALRYVHRRDIIHRDIKPQNIIIDNEGRVKVTDFGIARARGVTSLTEVGTSIGTAHYLSPEQAQGLAVEAASDLYSTGVVMYEMATGRLPFDAETSVGIAMQHVHDDPPPPRGVVPSIPENLETVILRAMSKQPTDRYLTAQAMLDDIWRVQEGKPVDTHLSKVGQSTRAYGATGAAAGAGEWTAQARGSAGQPPRGPIEGEPLPEDYFGQDNGKKKNWVLWGAVTALLIALIVTAVSIYWWGGPGELAAVPNVVGLSQEKAKADLSDAGFKVATGDPRPSATVAQGLVGDQDPDAGTPMRKGETVNIYLSSGNAAGPLPSVVGMDRVTAVDKLEGLGLKVMVTEEPTDDTSKINYVQRQDPAPNTVVQPGQTVTIFVAVPNDMVTVPYLIGSSQTAAETALASIGLVPKVTAVDSTLDGGTVLTQDPVSGTQVQAGAEVTLTVSNRPVENRVSVPPVAQVGMSLSQAENLLKTFHLKWTVEYYETDVYAAGLVIQQSPVAGTVVPANSTVTLTVAKAPTPTTAPPTTSPPTTSPPETTAP
jgi:beta-lactam-binding protein with PASTA domain/predicted Ser/Thr protein kinase